MWFGGSNEVVDYAATASLDNLQTRVINLEKLVDRLTKHANLPYDDADLPIVPTDKPVPPILVVGGTDGIMLISNCEVVFAQGDRPIIPPVACTYGAVAINRDGIAMLISPEGAYWIDTHNPTSWEKVPWFMPPIGKFPSITAAGDWFYMVTGNNHSERSHHVYRVGVTTGVTNVATLQHRVSAASMTYKDDRLYVAGGHDGDHQLDLIQVVDLKTMQTSILEHRLPCAITAGDSAFVDEDTLVYAGGWSGDDRVASAVAINVATGEVTRWASLPAGMNRVKVIADRGRLFVVGGNYDGPGTDTVFELTRDRCILRARMQHKRHSHAIAIIPPAV